MIIPQTLLGSIAVAMLLTSQAAAQEVTSFVGPSGRTVHQVKCKQSPQACYQAANRACQGPYQVLDSESHAGGLLADLFPGPVTWYGMTFSCGQSDGRLPKFTFRGQPFTPPARRAPSMTNCQMFGGTVTCQSY
jgi:hypothetical protein